MVPIYNIESAIHTGSSTERVYVLALKLTWHIESEVHLSMAHPLDKALKLIHPPASTGIVVSFKLVPPPARWEGLNRLSSYILRLFVQLFGITSTISLEFNFGKFCFYGTGLRYGTDYHWHLPLLCADND